MYETREVLKLANVNVAASGNTADIDVRAFERIGVDINFKTLAGGATPGVTFTVQRKDLNGNYQTLFSFTALTAVGFTNKDIGAGMEVAKLPGTVIRVAWVTTGAPATAVADISILGDTNG